MKEKLLIKNFQTKAEMELVFYFIKKLYPDMTNEVYLAHLDEMIRDPNFNMIGAYLNNKLVGLSSYWIQTRLYSGKNVEITNIVVDDNLRSLGVGSELVKYVQNKGKEQGCKKFILSSYTQNKKSHKFYFNEGFFIEGLHFMKDI